MEPVTRDRVTTSVLIAAVCSVGAGLVHAAAAGTHSDDAQLARLFAVCAAAQIGWAAAVIAWPRRSTLAAGLVLNGGCVAIWGLTRTVGLFGPLADVEAVGSQDLIAAALGAGAAGAAVVALVGWVRRPSARREIRLDVPLVAVASVLVAVMTVPAMAASHAHNHTHETAAHTHGEETSENAVAAHSHTDVAATSGHSHGATDTTNVDSSGAEATGPVVSLDDPRLTSAQRARASDLLARTRAAMAAYPDDATLVAAGYTWIGDGRRAGGFQHFVNAEYMNDGRTLDPTHIESIVLQVQPDGVTKQVMSAMYIAEPGTTMETVPDIGGALTVWHDHQNLCWNGPKLAGVVVDGRCVPGGTFRPTPPMIHVWIDDPPCGPFSGIEGHGGANCEHTHTGA